MKVLKKKVFVDGDALPDELRSCRSRIMYIEDKSLGLEGPARIGRVYVSKTGKTLYYGNLVLKSLKGSGFKANYFDVETGAEYWLSGPRKDQNDRLYGGNNDVEIDGDVRDEYRALISAS
ncbi:MAG: 1-deoxy-D-xylulose-5-phosphate synthase [Gammaproteobacteria bacterium]|nr:MAG: 1-deoxy-D-xylulose-5-phosphate synthase [Gammaproteobacteria bacterium]